MSVLKRCQHVLLLVRLGKGSVRLSISIWMAWFDLVTFAFQSTKISSTFALNTYERNIQVVDVLSTELPVLLDVLRKTLPEGVSLSGNLTVNTTFIFIDLVAWSQDYLLYFDSSQAWEGALRGKVHPRPFDKQVCLLTQFSDKAFATRWSKKTLLDLSLLISIWSYWISGCKHTWHLNSCEEELNEIEEARAEAIAIKRAEREAKQKAKGLL